MAIKAEIWAQIRSLFESGKNQSEIAQIMLEAGIQVSRTSINKRAKKENWQAGKFTPIINAKVKAIKDLVDTDNKIHTQIHTDAQPVVNKVVDEKLELLGLCNNLAKAYTNLHVKIARKITSDLDAGRVSAAEAAYTAKVVGMTLPVTMQVTGMQPNFEDKPGAQIGGAQTPTDLDAEVRAAMERYKNDVNS